MIYVLTRTANRPRMFARLRASLAQQTVPARHVVHAEAGRADYAEGDIVIVGERLRRSRRSTAPWELYHARLLERLQGEPPGWIVFIDDDDEFTSPDTLEVIARFCREPLTIPIWRTLREGGRVSPAAFGAPLDSSDGRICWESAALHTSRIPEAIAAIDDRDGGDGRMWAALARTSRVEWVEPFIMARPQVLGPGGKGCGRARDRDVTDLTVAIPILGRPHAIEPTLARFSLPGVQPLFLPDEADTESVRALDRLRAPYGFAPIVEEWGCATYSSKVNHAYRTTSAPFLLYASDDAEPDGDWWDRAREWLQHDGIGVLATNDHLNPMVKRGLIATHGIVRRAYVEEFGSASLTGAGPVFFEGYRHWCCDAELSYAARLRQRFAFAPDVVVAHKRGASDATYELGRSYAKRDRETLMRRAPGWPWRLS